MSIVARLAGATCAPSVEAIRLVRWIDTGARWERGNALGLIWALTVTLKPVTSAKIGFATANGEHRESAAATSATTGVRRRIRPGLGSDRLQVRHHHQLDQLMLELGEEMCLPRYEVVGDDRGDPADQRPLHDRRAMSGAGSARGRFSASGRRAARSRRGL